MAGQSITFDFLTRGADNTAAGFRKVGDNTVLAARGAKVLADAIEKLGGKENRTAAESKILAEALRKTGDAEDRVAARAVLADAAVRRLDDAMKAAAKKREAELKVKVDDSALGKLRKAVDGISGKGPSALVSSAILLAPAIASLGGVTAGAAVGLSGAFIAGGAALAAFGAIAKPVLTDAKTAATAVNAAQNTYNATIAAGVPKAQALATLQKANAGAQLTYNAALKGGAKPATALAAYHLALARNQLAYNSATSTGTFNAKAYAAEQKAIGKAYADLSPQQIALSKQLGKMADAWQALKAAETPVVAGALQPWLKSVTDLTKNLAPIIAKISPVIGYLGTKFDDLVNSSAFKGFRDFIGSTGAAAVSAGGSTIIDLIKSFTILLPQFDPLIREAIGWISRLGPAVLTWSNSKKASDDIQKFLQWFSRNGPAVGGFLKNIGGALKALAPGLASGGAAELNIMSAFFGFVAKLPPSIAKPLAEVAGALLLLNKLGVVKAGVQLIGWSFGKGGGAAAAGGEGAAAAEGAAAGGLMAKLTPGLKWAVKGGLLIAGAKIALSIAGSEAPKATTPEIKSFQKATPGGVRKFLDFFFGSDVNTASVSAYIKKLFGPTANWGPQQVFDWLRHAVANQFDNIRHDDARIWDVMTNDLAKAFDIFVQGVGIAWDEIKLTFLGGVSFILNVMSKLPGPLGKPFRDARLDIASSMAGVQADVLRRTGQIQSDINSIHGKTVPIDVAGSGSGGVVITTSGIAAAGQGNVRFHAARGAFVNTGSGPTADDNLARVSKGELIVPAHMVSAGWADNMRGRIPGFGSGGFVGVESALGRVADVAAGVEGRGAAAAMAAGVKAAIARETAALKAAGGASGSAIADYAMSFLGKIPYVWGGTAVPGGADCSGFTQAIYKHFGIGAPRTSEAQGAWVHRSGPVPGGLAFYDSPAGGPPPGHVAIVRSAQQVISQGGGMGPQMMNIHALPLLWTGVPPGGLPSGGGGGGPSAGRMSAAAIAALWTADGGPGWAASNMAAIANAESGDIPSARQTGQPPGLTGWGLYQITPTSGISQNGAFGDLLNASNNTRAAISLFGQSGYGPWASDPVAAGLLGAGARRGFAGGGVAGYASGGTVPKQGAALLKAWQTRHGGGFGAAWGPVPVNPQIDAMNAAQHRAATLARAPGLSAAQRRHYTAAAADEKKRAAALTSERDTERSWRSMLGVSDTGLAAAVRAAGATPSLAKNVTSWKTQIARQKAAIGNISKMLGLSAAQVAAAQKAGTLGPGGAALPVVTHSYGGDVTNSIGAFLASVAAPFGAARGGLVFDRGGWLKPGWNATYNGTGRPEHLLPARGSGSGDVHLHVHGPVGSEAELERWLTAAIRKGAKTRGGGSVERAYSAH